MGPSNIPVLAQLLHGLVLHEQVRVGVERCSCQQSMERTRPRHGATSRRDSRASSGISPSNSKGRFGLRGSQLLDESARQRADGLSLRGGVHPPPQSRCSRGTAPIAAGRASSGEPAGLLGALAAACLRSRRDVELACWTGANSSSSPSLAVGICPDGGQPIFRQSWLHGANGRIERIRASERGEAAWPRGVLLAALAVSRSYLQPPLGLQQSRARAPGSFAIESSTALNSTAGGAVLGFRDRAAVLDDPSPPTFLQRDTGGSHPDGPLQRSRGRRTISSRPSVDLQAGAYDPGPPGERAFVGVRDQASESRTARRSRHPPIVATGGGLSQAIDALPFTLPATARVHAVVSSWPVFPDSVGRVLGR